MDGTAGGDKTDDLFAEDWQAIRTRAFLDNLIVSFIEANLTDINRTLFNVTSFDVNCSDDEGPGTCNIVGYSNSSTAATDTFKVDTLKKRITLDMAGQGDVIIDVPLELTLNGTFSFVRSFAGGGSYEFEALSQDASVASIMIKGLAPHPRNIALVYGTDLVSPTPVSVLDIDGQPALNVTVGDQVVLSSNITNIGGWDQNFTSLIEIRNSTGVTQFLQPVNGTLGPDAETNVAVSWVPENAGKYTLRIFVINDPMNPEVLSIVRETVIVVGP
jgi:hypothetical protein